MFQTAGERNYHIFYQLVAGADENPQLREQLQLDGCEAFAYLNQSGVTRIEGQVEEVEFDEVRVCICVCLYVFVCHNPFSTLETLVGLLRGEIVSYGHKVIKS